MSEMITIELVSIDDWLMQLVRQLHMCSDCCPTYTPAQKLLEWKIPNMPLECYAELPTAGLASEIALP